MRKVLFWDFWRFSLLMERWYLRIAAAAYFPLLCKNRPKSEIDPSNSIWMKVSSNKCGKYRTRFTRRRTTGDTHRNRFITRKISRISTEHIDKNYKGDSPLQFLSICSVRILNKNRDFRQKPNAQFLTWEDATDPTRGYCSPSHQLVLEAEVFADAPHGIQWDSKARIYLVIKL